MVKSDSQNVQQSKEKKESSAKERKGIPCSEESLAEYNKTWTDIEEAIDNVNKNGKEVKRWQ